MSSRIAIIDMGTNTFHLLIAEPGVPPRILFRDRIAVRIGQGGINDNRIVAEAQNRAITALLDFKKILDTQQVGRTLAFGTSAIRNASNGQAVIDEIRAATGIDARIIDGEEEAELIYRGVKAALPLGKETSLIVDIGGGSVEFILANEDQIFWKHSFEIGAQRLLERFQQHDPILPSEIRSLEKYFEEQLPLLLQQLKKWNPSVLVGSSGTFDTLSEIYYFKNGMVMNPDDSETLLTLDSIRHSHQQIIAADRAGRLRIPGMIEMRVDMIVVASCLVTFLLDSHSFDRVRVSTYSLKEGVLASLQDPSLQK